MRLETDAHNLAEYQRASVTMAAARYRERVLAGYQWRAAYAETLAYLRRKTQWPAPLAAAALDDELATVPTIPDLTTQE
jgi:hypothetical protein